MRLWLGRLRGIGAHRAIHDVFARSGTIGCGHDLLRTAQDPHVLLRMLTSMDIVALLNMLYYPRSERSLDFVYGSLYTYFAFFTLSWIVPHAPLTMRARAWLTR